jgi:hypothetical protein
MIHRSWKAETGAKVVPLRDGFRCEGEKAQPYETVDLACRLTRCAIKLIYQFHFTNHLCDLMRITLSNVVTIKSCGQFSIQLFHRIHLIHLPSVNLGVRDFLLLLIASRPSQMIEA